MVKLVSYFIYPAYVLVAMAVFFGFSGTLTGELALKGLLLSVTFGAWALILLQEKVIPYRRDWQKNQGDLLSDAVQSAVIFPLISEAVYKTYNFVLEQPLKSLWPHQLPAPIQLILILLIAEYGHYWYHRISHRRKWLWRFHKIHHGALRVYSLNSARFHVVDIVFNMLVYLAPLSLFGVNDEVFYAFLAINGVTGLLEHANIRFDAGLLNYLFNSAQLHRWHHSEIGSESRTNFGKVLCVWDFVHGTRFLPVDREVGAVGLKKQIVPVTLLEQMFFPFEERRKKSRKSEFPELRNVSWNNNLQ